MGRTTVTIRLLLFVAGISVLLSAAAGWVRAELSFPPLSGRVVDEAGLLTAAERQNLTEKLKAHEEATGNQVVVATLKSLQGTSIEDYGYQLGRAWGIGRQGKDDGVLLIVAPSERKVRIEVGYGLEGVLTDAATRLIIEGVMLPEFRSGKFGSGIVAGADAIMKMLSGEEVPLAKQVASTAKRKEASMLPLLLLGGFVLLIWLSYRNQRRRSWAMRRRRRGGFVPIIFPGGWGGGGWGGGSGGDGGFGGGGGSFGGGGASGDW